MIPARHGLADATSAGQPYTAICRNMHIHPTVTEPIPTPRPSPSPLE